MQPRLGWYGDGGGDDDDQRIPKDEVKQIERKEQGFNASSAGVGM